jgi:MFS family permease
VAASFIVLGMFWGSWAVVIANVQQTFGLSDATLGLLLAAAIGVAAVTGAVVGHRAERWGTRRLLTGSLIAWAVLLVGAGLARPWPVFAVCFAAAEVAGGCVDTAMNAAASRRLMGQPGALVRFHALFNTGALSGAAASGIALHFEVSWRWLWPALALAVLAVAWWAHVTPAIGVLLPVPAAPTPAAGVVADAGSGQAPGTRRSGFSLGPVAQLRADGLLVFLVVFAIAEITEGGVDTWGVLYLRTHLAAGVLLGAGAYVIGQSVAATTRGAGGPLLGRMSARIALVVGGLVAAGGILVESISPEAVVAACGLAFGAAGASLFWPLVMSQATKQATRATAAVGAFTAAGYVGWVAGAPVVGWVSDTWGPARGLQLLAAAALLVVLASLLHKERVPSRSPDGTRPG